LKLAFVSYCGAPWGGCEVLWCATAKLALQQKHQVLVSVYDWGTQTHKNIKELETLGATMIYRKKFFPKLSERIARKLKNYFFSNNKITYLDYLEKFNPHHILFSLSGGLELSSDLNNSMVFIKNTTLKFSVFYHSIGLVPQSDIKQYKSFEVLANKAKNNFFTSSLQQNLFLKGIDTSNINSVILCHPLHNSCLQANKEPFPKTEIANFAIVGSVVMRWKSHDILFEIFKLPKWQKRNFVLNIYGAGEDKVFLQYLAKKYEIEAKINFCGYEENPQNIWKKNHILLAPSRQDSGPIVVFEAMACKRAVVGSYMGAMPSYISTNSNGVLANGIMEHNFEEALEFAWQNKNNWEQWGINAKKTMDEMYDYNPQNTLLNYLIKQ
jgi:L-malate glycosyltransferase